MKTKTATSSQMRIVELDATLDNLRKENAQLVSMITQINARNRMLETETGNHWRVLRDDKEKFDEERRELEQKANMAQSELKFLRSCIIEYFAAMASETAVPIERLVAMQRRIAGLPALGYNENGCSIASKTLTEFPPGGNW